MTRDSPSTATLHESPASGLLIPEPQSAGSSSPVWGPAPQMPPSTCQLPRPASMHAPVAQQDDDKEWSSSIIFTPRPQMERPQAGLSVSFGSFWGHFASISGVGARWQGLSNPISELHPPWHWSCRWDKSSKFIVYLRWHGIGRLGAIGNEAAAVLIQRPHSPDSIRRCRL